MQIFYQLQECSQKNLQEQIPSLNDFRVMEKKQGTQSDGGGSGFRALGSNLENISGGHVSTIPENQLGR
jgi:hypothetical protein